MFPTANQIAHAIVAACKITGADPIAVASRESDMQNQLLFPIARARSYAALALRERFPDLPNAAVDRVVGCRTLGVFLSALMRRVKAGGMPWLDPERLAGVVQAIPEADALKAGALQQNAPARQPGPPGTLPVPRSGTKSPAPAAAAKQSCAKSQNWRPESDFVRYGSKRRLEEELRQAVLNTGGKPV